LSSPTRSATEAPRALPAPPARPAHVIKSDAEAIAIARDLATKFAPEAAARDRERRLPRAELDLFSQSGLWAMNVPSAFGGAEVSYTTVAEVFKIIAAADASIAQIAQNHVSILDLVRFDPDLERQRLFYGAALQGLRFGNATSERGGKHVRDFQTRIAKTGADAASKGFVVNGEKFYATGALFAHLVPVTAVNEDGKTVLAFVAAGTPGLTIIDDWSGFGQRTTASGTVVLKDVFVPEDHVLRTYLAFDTPSVHGPVAQIIQAGIDAGIAQGAIDETLRFVREKARAWTDSGQARASDDLFTIRDIGDLMIKLHAAEAVLARAGRGIDRGLRDETPDNVAIASVAVAEAKVLTTEIAILATNKLFELSGTRSVLAADNLDRHWRDARTHTLHDPVRWKFHAIGNYHLNGIAPPRHLWL
jgi:SfnB family sulfur acquisition oxidoreductase